MGEHIHTYKFYIGEIYPVCSQNSQLRAEKRINVTDVQSRKSIFYSFMKQFHKEKSCS